MTKEVFFSGVDPSAWLMCLCLHTVLDLGVMLGLCPPDRQGWGCSIPCLAGTRSSKDLRARSFPRTQESKRIKGPSADHIYFII